MSLCNNHFDVKGNTAHSSGELNLITMCDPSERESPTSGEGKEVRLLLLCKKSASF
jgi:hypothetical protein